jgi:hypothetical protein
MQTAGSNIGTEQRLDVCILEKETREMQDVLMRSVPSFQKGLSIHGRRVLCVMNLLAAGRERNFCFQCALTRN